MESVIKLQKQNIEIIRLNLTGNANCHVPGNMLRFQYQIHPEKEIPGELISRLYARTKTIKVEKVLGSIVIPVLLSGF